MVPDFPARILPHPPKCEKRHGTSLWHGWRLDIRHGIDSRLSVTALALIMSEGHKENARCVRGFEAGNKIALPPLALQDL